MRGWLGNSDASLLFCPDRPTNALWGTNLDFIVANPMGGCYCLPENPDKLWLHEARHCPVVKKADVAAREGHHRGGRISSLHLTAAKLPSTTINCDFIPFALPPKT